MTEKIDKVDFKKQNFCCANSTVKRKRQGADTGKNFANCVSNKCYLPEYIKNS